MNGVLVLCPLAAEAQALVQGVLALGHRGEAGILGRLQVTRFPTLHLKVAQGGHGKAQFAIQAQHLIQSERPELLVCAGISGALTRSLRALDVVAATQTLEHDFRLRFVKRPLPSFSGDVPNLERLKGFSSPQFRLHFGAVASGDEDVIETLRAEELFQQTQALAVAWEGAGGARAAKFNNLPYLELRAISDFADPDAIEHAERHLERAMGHLAEVLIHLAKHR